MSDQLPHLFIIGSSMTLRFGPYLKQMLRGMYKYSRKGDESAEIKKAFKDLGILQVASAGDSSMVLDYLKELDQTESFHPDIVLLAVGGHDIRRDVKTHKAQVPLENYRENVDAIVDWFKRKRIKLVWFRGGPFDERLHNAEGEKLPSVPGGYRCLQQGCGGYSGAQSYSVLDSRGFMSNLGPIDQLINDHVHFKDDIVKLQAAFIAGYLMNLT